MPFLFSYFYLFRITLDRDVLCMHVDIKYTEWTSSAIFREETQMCVLVDLFDFTVKECMAPTSPQKSSQKLVIFFEKIPVRQIRSHRAASTFSAKPGKLVLTMKSFGRPSYCLAWGCAQLP
jgi:hypothetical protein